MILIIPSLAFASWWNPISWFQKPIINTEIKTTPAPVSVDWKTYENKKLGFAFEYPKNWAVYDNSSISSVYVLASSCPTTSKTTKDKACSPITFMVGVNATTSRIPSGLLSGWTKTKIQVAGIDATEIIEPNLSNTEIGFMKDSNYYHLVMNKKGNTKEEADPILNHILLSFTFTTSSGSNTTLVVPSIQVSHTNDTARLKDVRKIEQSLEVYYADNNSYPSTIKDLVSKYINPLPISPKPADGSCTENQNSYIYTQIDSGQNYTLTFCLGNASGGFKSGLHTASSGEIK